MMQGTVMLHLVLTVTLRLLRQRGLGLCDQIDPEPMSLAPLLLQKVNL